MSKTLTLRELAELVGGAISQGESTASYNGLNSLSEASPGEISFLGNPKYEAQVASTKASAILVSPDFGNWPEGVGIVTVANPTLAFSEVIRFFAATVARPAPGIHPTAVVSPTARLDAAKVYVGPLAVIEDGAEIGDGSIIHASAAIGQNAMLGRDCIIYPHAIIRDHCVLGDRVIIHSSTVIGSDGFGYEFQKGRHVKIEQVGIVEIGSDVEIGAATTIDRARFGKTMIGEGTKIDNQVQIAHNVVIGKHCILVSQVGISGSTHLGDYVVMGGQSGASGHLKIASQVTILGRSGVIKDLTEPGHYTGFPARPLMEGRRLMGSAALVPKLRSRIKDLEKRLDELERRLPP